MTSGKPVLVSGIKPSGELHLGNYFGAMRQQVELAKSGKYKAFIFIADYHALNTVQDAEDMRRSIRHLVLGYLAAGIDPNEVVIFKQSDVPACTELSWIFDTITDIPYLARAHAFKAAVDKLNDAHPTQRSLSSKLEQLTDVPVGVFNYPMLMAADILLYDAAVVPVGQDQKQHVEYARDTAEKFNRIFGGASEKRIQSINGNDNEYSILAGQDQIFKLPEPYILPDVAVVPGIDGQKMSKSYRNVIPLFASSEELQKKVMSIVTDSTGDRPENVYAIHKLIKTEGELKPIYDEHKGNYKALKEKLFTDLDAFLAPMRAKYEELEKNSSVIDAVLKRGADEARAIAEAKMVEVRKAIGVA